MQAKPTQPDDRPTTRRNTDLRRRNTLDVVDLLRLNGRMTRADLGGQTTLSSQALATILNELVEVGIVQEVAVRGGRRGRGRPALQYEYNADRTCVLSLYIGLRYAELSLCDGLGRRIADNIEFTPGWDVADVVAQSSERMNDLIRAAEVDDRPCQVAVVVHGWVDGAAGTATSTAMGWNEVPIVSLLEGRVDASVTILEASRAAAIAESREGEANGCRRATVLNLGPEITATQVIDGLLDAGASGHAGMIGRCLVATSQGVLPIDDMIGSFAGKRHYNELAGDDVKWMTDVYTRARAGDPHAITVLDSQIEGMAFAASWLIAVDDPEQFVLTGAVSDFSEAARAQLHTAITDLTDPRALERCSIRLSSLGRQAWIRGGVHAALDQQQSSGR